MFRGPKPILIFLAIAVIAIIAYRYSDYVLTKDYLLEVQVACDPATQSCFVADCSPEDDPECDTTPYAKAEVLASEAPACLEEHACETFSCDGRPSCSLAYCADDALEEGEVCALPDEPEPAEE